jgi:iron complex transport system substrate-binding protein
VEEFSVDVFRSSRRVLLPGRPHGPAEMRPRVFGAPEHTSGAERRRRSCRRTGPLGLLVAALLLASCGSPQGAETGESTDSGYPVTVDHVMGTTEIPSKPVRVVALDQTFVDAAFTLGIPLAGFTDLSPNADRLPAYLGEFRSTLGKDAVSLGELDNPNLEQLASLRPDLILSAKIRHEEIYDELSRIAPTVFSETTGPTWKENLRLLAEAMGEEEAAEERIARYESRAKAVGDAIRAKEGRNPTISLIRFLGQENRLYQKASFSGVVLEDTGLARPPSQDVDDFAVAVSEERIPDADADRIFYTVYDLEDARAARERFQANPLWGRLQGEVTEVSDEVWGLAVGLQGAEAMLDDLAKSFGVPSPPRN